MQDKTIVISLSNILVLLKERIISISIIFFSTALAAYFLSFSIPNQYTSGSVLSIVSEEKSNIASGNLSSLASIAGVNLGDNNRPNEIVETIKSRNFLARLLEDKKWVPILSVAKNYDPTQDILIFDNKYFDQKNGSWKFDKKGSSYEPSVIKIHRDNYLPFLEVYLNKMNNLIYVSFTHISPEIAYEFNNLIIKELNASFREKDLKEYQLKTEFLYEEAKATSDLEIKSSINNLIELNLKQKMIATITKEYAVKILDSPFVPDKKSRPRRSIIMILSAISITFIYFLFMLYRNYKESEV